MHEIGHIRLSSAKPWEQRPEWRDGRIRSSGVRRLRFAWIFAMAWNAFLALIAVIAGPELWERFRESGETVLYMLPMFVLAGVFLLGRAFYLSLRQRKYGVSVLELDAIPGVIGGRLRGRIATRLTSRSVKPIALTLTCSHVWISRVRGSRGEYRSDLHINVLWSHELEIPPESLEPGSSGLLIPVDIFVPYGLKPSDESNADDRIVWELTAYAELRGVDFLAEFEVPFFVTPDSRPETIEERQTRVALLHQAPPYTSRGFRTPVDITETPSGGVIFLFRPEVPISQAVLSTLITLAILAVAPFGIVRGWHWVIAVVALLFGGLLTLGAAAIWGLVGRLTIEGGHLELHTILFSIGFGSPRRVPCSEVTRVGVCRSVKKGASRKNKSWSLEILLKNGEALDPAAMVSSRIYAVWLAAEVERRVLSTCSRRMDS